MDGLGQDVAANTVVAVSLLLAIALPLIAWRHFRIPGALPNLWLYSKPGAVVAWSIVFIVLCTLSGGLFSILALTYPFLWATVALALGSLLAAVVFLVRYWTIARVEASRQLSEENPS